MLTPAPALDTPMTRRPLTPSSILPPRPHPRTSAGRAAGWRPARPAATSPPPTLPPAGRPAPSATNWPAATRGARPRTTARIGRAPGASRPTLPPIETYIPNARAVVLGPGRLLTCRAGRRGPVAGTGPAAGTRTPGRPSRRAAACRPVPVAGAPAARVAWATRMRARPVLAATASVTGGTRMRARPVLAATA